MSTHHSSPSRRESDEETERDPWDYATDSLLTLLESHRLDPDTHIPDPLLQPAAERAMAHFNKVTEVRAESRAKVRTVAMVALGNAQVKYGVRSLSGPPNLLQSMRNFEASLRHFRDWYFQEVECYVTWQVNTLRETLATYLATPNVDSLHMFDNSVNYFKTECDRHIELTLGAYARAVSDLEARLKIEFR